ncbi:MAG: alanyl-tRNA editing protein [Pseudomonadota bacterium]|nr:alanyl-tRNA editing protein [Pseudomonadota bacterium]
MTTLLFRDDPYLKSCTAETAGVNERGGILLDRTIFYATSGGQPGDKGTLVCEGRAIPIATTVYDEQKNIVHVPAAPAELPASGAAVTLTLDWDARYRHMRAHTALHLLCSLVRFPVTGGQIAGDGGRLDFDIPDAGAVDRAQLEDEINRLITEDHPVSAAAISDAELAKRPELVRTMSVKPPMGSGLVRLVSIGEGGRIDLQPCGGTHVRSTAEIGPITVGKLESKGRQNRRIRITFR